jgi:HD superfamily phosphohydrolase
LARYISDFDREKIIGLLRGSAGESIARSVISGPLDADKQDYLLRDSYFCGVKYGVFDSARLIGTLQVYSEHHDRHLAASSGGIYAIEQFVLAKYHMSTQVYRHKIRLITDSMIGRALELGIEHDSLSWLRDLYAYNGSPEFISNYLGWDDARLVTEICRSKNTLTRELFLRLKERRLLKIVFDIPLPEVEDPKVRNFLAELRKRNDFRTRLEQDVSDYLSKKLGMAVPPHEVIARTYAIKSVREESRNNEGKIMILSEDGSRASFEEKSTLFRSIDQKWNDQFLQVYAPVVYEDDVKKRRMKEEFAQDIGRIVMDLASSQVKPGNTQQEEDHGAQRP